ncbi:MAG: hypothetical protein ACK5L5_07445 [Bacteroidales bacterium]
MTKEISNVKCKESMRATAYLLPPRQRSVARFMNLQPTVSWAKSLMSNFFKLNNQEKSTFGFIWKYCDLIFELQQIFDCIGSVQNILKTKGLSLSTVNQCKGLINKQRTINSGRVEQVKRNMIEYLNGEFIKLSSGKDVWHASSDIIESLFVEATNLNGLQMP